MRRLTLAVPLMLVVGACNGAPAADGEGFQIAAAFYPIAHAAETIAGDRAQVTNLTPPGAEPHDVELTARDVIAVEQADLVIYVGGGFQPALERALRDRRGPSVDALTAVEEIASDADHAGDDDEPADGKDPHVWLDPLRMRAIVEHVAERLANIDPQGARTYNANAESYAGELTTLHSEMLAGLGECERRVLVTSHAAFGYLAARYGLQQEAIAGVSPDAEPTAGRLDDLRDLVEQTGTTTVFTEVLVSARVADTLAREAGVRTDVLDPVEGLTEERRRAGDDYLDVMRDNLAALRRGLGCT